MRQASLAKGTSPHPPTSGSSRKSQCQRCVLVCIQTNLQPKIARAPAEQLVHRLSEQVLTGAIDQPQAPFGIEGENGNVDLRHDRPKQRRRFESAKALKTQCFAERVYFQ